jgi:hypothetical protein
VFKEWRTRLPGTVGRRIPHTAAEGRYGQRVTIARQLPVALTHVARYDAFEGNRRMGGCAGPSVLCNMPVAIEQHAEWIADCISYMRRNGIERIEAEPEAMDQWVEKVNTAANATSLPMAAHSWYLGANVSGKPRVFMPYAGGMARYREICSDVAANNYDGFSLSEIIPIKY